jgi:DNA polymerase-3 subunit chi
VQVDFYQLGGRYQDPIEVAGVLVAKAWPQHRNIAIVAPSAQLPALDAQLWQTPAERFLPHDLAPCSAPIRLMTEAPEHADVLINLDPLNALPSGHYQRVLEIIPADASAREPLRQRWRAWQQRGQTPRHHRLS